MKKKYVEFNGIQAVEGWPEYVQEQQGLTHYLIDGKKYERIKYGDEDFDWGADKQPCGDCGVLKGQYHVSMPCDVEMCPCCKEQSLGCGCDKKVCKRIEI